MVNKIRPLEGLEGKSQQRTTEMTVRASAFVKMFCLYYTLITLQKLSEWRQ